MAESSCEMTEDDIIINDQDGLPNVHPNLLAEADIDSPEHASDDEFEDLPTSLIVTNIHDSVFTIPGTHKKGLNCVEAQNTFGAISYKSKSLLICNVFIL